MARQCERLHVRYAVRLHLCSLAFCLGLCTLYEVRALASSPTGTETVEVRREALKDLLAEEWETEMLNSPVYATLLGDLRYNDRLGKGSPAEIKRQAQERREYLTRFEAIDTTGLGTRSSWTRR